MANYYFIGNSITFFNKGVYFHFNNLLKSAMKESKVDYLCKPNENLKGHFENPSHIEKIEKNKYDYVILQEESFRPLTLEGREEYLFPYSKKFAEIIKKNNGKIVYYMTMAKQHKSYNSYKRDQEKIREAYFEIAKLTDGIVVPVGMAWNYMRENRPEINLYNNDYPNEPHNNIHPNLSGIYLAACVFYKALVGDLIEDGANYIPEGMDIGEAVAIRGAAKREYDCSKNMIF